MSEKNPTAGERLNEALSAARWHRDPIHIGGSAGDRLDRALNGIDERIDEWDGRLNAIRDTAKKGRQDIRDRLAALEQHVARLRGIAPPACEPIADPPLFDDAEHEPATDEARTRCCTGCGDELEDCCPDCEVTINTRAIAERIYRRSFINRDPGFMAHWIGVIKAILDEALEQ